MRHHSGRPANGTATLDDPGSKGRTLETNRTKFAPIGATFLAALIVATLLAVVALPTTSRAATPTRTYITTDDVLVSQSKPNDNRGGSPRLRACNINGAFSGNVVRNNVISNFGGNVEAIDGANNRDNNNCLREPNGTSGFHDGPGLSVPGNVVENPRHRDRQSFAITNRTCLAKYGGTLARLVKPRVSADNRRAY